jgi:hypothetical protein
MGLFGRGNSAGSSVTGTQAIAQVKVVTQLKSRKDEATWSFALLVRRADREPFTAQIEQTLPNSVGNPQKWLQVPVLYDPTDVRDWNKVSIDVSRLASVELTKPLPPDPGAARSGTFVPAAPKGWNVPHECPNCGAIVDQVMQSRAAVPKCTFCGQPLPVSR